MFGQKRGKERKELQTGENYIKRSFIICALVEILIG
jgi:hypothetical protein